jgi:hypothetical protein
MSTVTLVVGDTKEDEIAVLRYLPDVVFARDTDGAPWLWAFGLPVDSESGIPGLYRVLAVGMEEPCFVVHIV